MKENLLTKTANMIFLQLKLLKQAGIYMVCSRKMVHALLVFLTFIVVLTFIQPTRNFMFHWYIPPAWRPLQTSDILKIHFLSSYPAVPGLLDTERCEKKEPLPVNVNHVRRLDMFRYTNLKSGRVLRSAILKGHGLYLPSLSIERKTNTLHLYMVFASKLREAGIPFFIAAGSLLGLTRHRGLVPWDDDIDVALHHRHWRNVSRLMSCFDEMSLHKEYNPWHWKLQTNGDSAFVDIFFYDENEQFLWSRTWYTRITFIYPVEDVFPLTTATFEGIVVPVPRNSLRLTRRIYDFDICSVYRSHGDRNLTKFPHFPRAYSTRRLDCLYLIYLYQMYHLHGT